LLASLFFCSFRRIPVNSNKIVRAFGPSFASRGPFRRVFMPPFELPAFSTEILAVVLLSVVVVVIMLGTSLYFLLKQKIFKGEAHASPSKAKKRQGADLDDKDLHLGTVGIMFSPESI
jgi:hypothetical protein